MRSLNIKFYSIISALLLSASSIAFAEIKVSDGFSTQQKQQIISSFQKINELAPPQLSALIKSQDISIEVQSGKSADQEIASAKGSTIFISPQVFNDAYFNQVLKKDTRHSDLNTFISAIIIHELAHILDKKIHTPEEQNFIFLNCENNSNRASDRQTSQTCAMLNSKKGIFSYNSSFISASGWQNSMTYNRLNFREQSSPDAYEFSSPREAFAVNLEYFVLDSNYGCKKPAVNTVLKKFFGLPPKQNQDCADKIGLVYATSGGVNKIVKLSQIQSVGYFFASKGTSAPSKYGHAMLYLTVCPQDKNPHTENCDTDINEHVVVSPAALVYRGISFFDGLSGKYDFTYFVVPATTAMQDYNVKELRDLELYPLKINNQEVAATIFDFIWNFTGKYYFLSNNCAHGVANVINTVFNMNSIFESGLNPLELRDNLIEKGIINKTPKTVFTADKTRKKIKDNILSTLAISWESLVAMPNSQRKTLFDSLVSEKKATWSGIAQVQYMIYQEQQDQIGMKLSLFVIEKKKLKDEEIKNLAKKSLDATSVLGDRPNYGIPDFEHIQTLVEKGNYLEEYHNGNKALLAEFKVLNEKALNEFVKSGEYYRDLLKEVLK